MIAAATLLPTIGTAGTYTVAALSSANVNCVQQVGGMDAKGDVVGVADFASLPFLPGPVSGLNAFLWHDGAFTPLPDYAGWSSLAKFPSGPGCSGGGASTASGIDPTGLLIVGTGASSDIHILPLASEWSSGLGPFGLGSLCSTAPVNAPSSKAYAVNAAGDVVGNSLLQPHCDGTEDNGLVPNGAFLRRSGIDGLIAASGSPVVGGAALFRGEIAGVAVNATDQVVVTNDNCCDDQHPNTLPSAYLWQPSSGASVFPGTLTALPLFPFGSSSLGIPELPASALGASSLGTSFVLNDAGVVVGVKLPLNATFLPAYSSNAGPAVTLTPANGLPQGAANGINNKGDVVGSSFNIATGTQVATLWKGVAGTPSSDGTDLNSLLPTNSGVTLYEAVGIDDNGDILAFGSAGGTLEVVELKAGVKTVTIDFAPSPVDANAPQGSVATVSVKDQDEKPVSGDQIQIEPPLSIDPLPGETSRTRALICDASDQLVYPGRFGDGSLDPGPFTETTDDGGQIPLHVWPGTIAGDWLLRAGELNAPEDEIASRLLTISASGRARHLPDALTSLLKAAASGSAIVDPRGNLATGQRQLLRWLSNVAPGLPAHYVPIHATPPGGGSAAGIVVFAPGANTKKLFAYLRKEPGAQPLDDRFAVVIDVGTARTFGFLSAGSQGLANRLPSIVEWEIGGQVPLNDGHSIVIPGHGPAQAGLLNPTGNEDLEYYEWPYPPPSNDPERVDFDRCIGGAADNLRTLVTVPSVPAPPPITAQIQSQPIQPASSPITLKVRRLGEQNQSAGLLPDGTLQDSIPGAVVTASAGTLTGFDLPKGSYRIIITGTGTAPAKLVFTTPQPGGDTTTLTFSFQASPGIVGKLKLLPTGPKNHFRFGHQKVTAQSGNA